MKYAALALALLLAVSCGSSGGKNVQPPPTPAEDAVNRAEILLRDGKVGAAKRRMKIALAGFQKKDNLKKTTATYNRLAQIALMEGNFNVARRYLASAGTIAEHEGYNSLLAQSVLGEASLMLAMGDGKSAMEALGSLKPSGGTSLDAKAENIRGRAKMAQNDYDGAQSHFEGALSLSRSYAYAPGISAALANLGILYMEKNEFQRAVGFLKEALGIDRKFGYTLSIGGTLHLIGKAYEKSSDLESALYFYNRALNVNMHIDIPRRAKADKKAIERVESKFGKR